MKIDLEKWAFKTHCLPLDTNTDDLSEEDLDRHYIEVGDKYGFCMWLQKNGYLKEDVEI